MGLWLICDIDSEYWRPAFPFASIIAEGYKDLESRHSEVFQMIEKELGRYEGNRHTIEETSFRASVDDKLGAVVWSYDGSITFSDGFVNPEVVWDYCVVEIDCIGLSHVK